MASKKYIPWVEKYRPTDFQNIVLNSENKTIFSNIFKKNYMPNLLLYGPPGTGKTTTIINLINEYQKKNDQENKGLMIHLNASDERGIDIIRNQINNFVNSKTMFTNGIKFVVLDEIDYMTKNAQQALKYLLQEYKENIRFCLICNYISKIDDSLQNEFVKLRFNQLPKEDIINFLSKINREENLKLSDYQIESIYNTYNSDIRSMINYMQSNQLVIQNTKVIDKELFKNINNIIIKGDNKNFNKEMYKLLTIYNIDLDTVIKDYCSYIIRNNMFKITSTILKEIEIIIHNVDNDCNNKINLLFYSLSGKLVS
ncbi:replication factor C small subunit [Chrysochromulina ericina virus CeV-01B]|jgi:replication factor C subunit 3/5|uniref:Replication factor C small subunit n=1 Tax=Chrysochromulina ericina virus CeV-01B TaxID=3070830 RepID=A0A0N9QZV9_9VIRU|nr:clamp loader of DNA polymerase [Chrysochromulina ericina virus]ALH22965.1 replication factor C small subunit [Chrysochromulina ericina virus CeV-01B]|tara:strand:+ start:24032 stop:24970 length:939 start_codon:yes stop_codon:yes gene_type:complete